MSSCIDLNHEIKSGGVLRVILIKSELGNVVQLASNSKILG